MLAHTALFLLLSAGSFAAAANSTFPGDCGKNFTRRPFGKHGGKGKKLHGFHHFNATTSHGNPSSNAAAFSSILAEHKTGKEATAVPTGTPFAFPTTITHSSTESAATTDATTPLQLHVSASSPEVVDFKTVFTTKVVRESKSITTRTSVATSSSEAPVVVATTTTTPQAVVTPTTTSAAPTSTTTTAEAEATAATTCSSTAGATCSQQAAALSVHNDARTKYHAPSLVWNQTLANAALTYSEKCYWGHSGGTLLAGGYGENLYEYSEWSISSTGEKTPIQSIDMGAAVQSWVNEVSEYDFSAGQFTEATGHFTQVVWKSTVSVGCALTWCGNNQTSYTVCEYYPPGNYAGEFTQNVLPA